MEDLLSAAAKFINTTAGHIFLTGKAGTGKTTFLKTLGKLTHKSHIVVAPTGIAALNAGGVTIHSQFLLPPATFIPDRSLPDTITDGGNFINQNTLARKHPLNSIRKQALRSIDLLVIDEVSMLRADLLDAIDYRMRAVRGNFRQSFGGVQVLFIGDLYQLPPVVKNDQWEKLSRYYRSPWFYEARALQEDGLIYIELDKIFRQHDPVFIALLNNLRNNTATREDLEVLNNHYKTPEEISNLREIITLTTHNNKAEEINQRELRSLDTPSHFFDARIEDEFPDSLYPVQPKLELKQGAQIMFVRNDSEDKMYFNGKLATVTEISGRDIWVEMAESHVRYKLKPERWENKKYKVNEGTHELEEDVIGGFEQFPVRLAWAITVHKSQGLTFDKAIIDVGQAFADGQVYVALSRLRSLEGLVLRTRIGASVISTDKQVVEFVHHNHRPDQLDGVMKARQQQFIHQLLDKTFDFTPIIKEIRHVAKEPDQEGLGESTMKPVLAQLADALEAERGNTEKFRRQLSDLLQGNDSIALIDRMRKGTAYYKPLLFQHMKTLLEHLETVRLGKRVKTYVNDLTELDQVLTKKWEEVDKVSSLAEGILSGEETIEFDRNRTARAEERKALLKEIRELAEKNGPPLKKRKRKKDAMANEEGIPGEVPRKRKSRKEDGKTTFDITLDLINSGMTAEQIAEERGLVVGTIESHLAKAVAAGTLSIFKFMSEDTVMEVVNVIRQLPEGFTSKDLYERLNGKFGYGQLRAVIAYSKMV